MQPTLCSRCKKNVAVVFISKLEGDRTINEGLCLKCAKDLGLPQVLGAFQAQALVDGPVALQLGYEYHGNVFLAS